MNNQYTLLRSSRLSDKAFSFVLLLFVVGFLTTIFIPTAHAGISAFAPTVTTDAPTDVTANSASLNATVNTFGTSEELSFEYGINPLAFSNTTKLQTVSSTVNQTVSLNISLLPNTIYYCRAKITTLNSGNVYGEVKIVNPLIPIAGLNLWLAADVGVSTGSNFSWTDVLNNEAMTSKSPPTRIASTAGFNGKPILFFNGTTNVLTTQNAINWQTAEGHTVFVVAQPDLKGATEGRALIGTGSGTNENMTMVNVGSQCRVTLGSNTLLSSLQTSTTNWSLFNAEASKSGYEFFKNAVRSASSSAPLSMTTIKKPIHIGSTDGVSDLFSGLIAEVLVYNRGLSVGERQKVEQYLNVKYNGVAATGSLLPLELLRFMAQRNAKTVNLDWQTAEETDLSYFVIEKSTDAKVFSPMQTVKSKGGAFLTNYAIEDGTPQYGSNFYRLRVVNLDGSTGLGKIVQVEFTGKLQLTVLSNPVSDRLNLQFATDKLSDSEENIKVMDIYGKLLINQTVKTQTGKNFVTLTISNLPNGTYFVKMGLDLVKFVKM